MARVVHESPVHPEAHVLPDVDFLLAHDRPGPRYTSYPTVPHWSEDVPCDLLDAALPRLEGPVDVYVHVPFCREQCLYCGCNMAVAGRQDAGDRFLDAIAARLDALPLPAARWPMRRLHLGGGTPTWLSAGQLRRLFSLVEGRFLPTGTVSRSVEADPQVTTEAHLDALADEGVGRLSFGVQSLDPGVLEAVQRPQQADRLRALVEGARSRGIARVNLDLMYGLPRQTPDTLRATLEGVLALEPDRLAVFGYAHVPWLKAHQRRLEPYGLPGARARAEQLLFVHRHLRGAGYRPVGFDHFARPDDPLSVALDDGTLHRDFMGYTDGGPGAMIGLGPSAISQLDDRFVQAEPRLGRWWKAVEGGRSVVHRGLVLSDDDRLRRDAILALTCRHHLDLDALSAAHGVDARAALAGALSDLDPAEADGLIRRDARGGVHVTERGRLLVRNVARAFDAYAPREAPGRFSRVV